MNIINYSINPQANALDQWDSGFIIDILESIGGEWVELQELEKAVVLLPARHHKGLEEAVNRDIQQIGNVIVVLIGDEEADFDVSKITHPSCHIWVQNPHPGKHDEYDKLGTGYPRHMRQYVGDSYTEKTLDLFFSGQITHKRRNIMWGNLLEYWNINKNIVTERTGGFTQGMTHKDYYEHMSKAKVAPAPSGAVIPDSFRLFEALELMTIPIAENINSQESITKYWDWFFGGAVPFPTINASDEWVGTIRQTIDDHARIRHQVTAWYIQYKRSVKLRIMSQYGL